MKRRTLLKATFVTGIVVATGMLSPCRVLARGSFIDIWTNSNSVQSVLLDLYGTSLTTLRPDEIEIFSPRIAEDRTRVYVSVNTTLKANSIAILVEDNDFPLSFFSKIFENTLGSVHTRIKMPISSNIIVVIESDGELYTARRKVLVTENSDGFQPS